MFDPTSLAATMVLGGGKQLYGSIADDYSEDVPTMDVGLGGGADLSGIRDAEYSQHMGFGQMYAKSVGSNISGGTLGGAATTVEYFRKKKAEREFNEQKKEALRRGIYMNSIGDFRDYQRRGMAESANAQMDKYIQGLMNTY